MWLINFGTIDDSAILKHVTKITQRAIGKYILCKIIGVMEMDNTCNIRFHDIFVKKNTLGNILRSNTSDIVTLDGNDFGILIGILTIDFFVLMIKQIHDSLIGGVTEVPSKIVFKPILSVGFCYILTIGSHKRIDNLILNLFHRHVFRNQCNFVRNRFCDSLG